MQKRKKTMGEPAAARRARRFARLLVPALTVPPLLGLAGGMTLNQILIHAKGRVPPEQIKRLLSQLEEL